MDGALFCHLCGQPQREDLIERERLASAPVAAPEQAPEVFAAASASSSPGGFDTRRAMRAALLAAIPCFFLLPVVAVLIGGASVVTLLLAGFLAVYLYGRSSPLYPSERSQAAHPLSLRAGARLGWITGMFTCLFTLILLALTMVLSPTPVRDAFRKQIEQQPVSGPDVQNAIEMLNSPAGFAAIIGTGIVFLFVAFTVLAALGGAVAAQLQIKAGEKKLT